MTDLFDHPAVAPSHGTGARTAARRRAAARRQRQRRRRRSVIIVTAVLVAVGAVAWTMFDDLPGLLPKNPFANSAEDYPGPGSGSVEVEIPTGATGNVMGQALLDAGVVASVGAFTEAFGQNPAAKGIQPGTYVLQSQMKASDAVAALVKNEKVELKVTIPEGFTAEQVLERITAVAGFTTEELDAAIADPASIGLPAEAGGQIEGWLFPATYTVTPKDTAVTVLSAMVAKTISELDAVGVAPEDRLDVLKKASLVEREAKFAPDRPIMARAIQNRLDQGRFLEIDASTAYGLGINGTKLTIAQNHDASNPYSLYKHKGLPPTPISNPGAASIEAVVHPADGDWIFWVAVNLDTGETKFSSTFEDHQKNLAELRAWQAANGD